MWSRPKSVRELAPPTLSERDLALRVGMPIYERAVRLGHRAYKLTLSPWFGRSCRFSPTCSDYAAEALITHGPLRGGWLATRRILKCHPFGASGFDPVPPRKQRS